MRKLTPSIMFFAAFMNVTLLLSPFAESSGLYVTGQTSVARFDTADGSGVTVYSGTGVSGIADDPLSNDLYYRTEQYPYRDLWRDNDPGVQDSSYSDVDKLQGVALMSNNLSFGNMDFDPLARNLFYSQYHTSYGNPYTSIQMLDADTKSVTTLYSASVRQIIGYSGYYNPQPIYAYVHEVADLAVDPLGDYLYWTDRYAGTVSRVNLTGTSVIEELYSGLVNPYGIAIDAAAGTLFWSEKGSSANGYDSFIKSASMSGGGSVSTLLSYDGSDSSMYFGSIDVDPDAGLLYFVQFLPGYAGYSGRVQYMDYSGQNVQSFYNASGNPVLGQLIDISSAAAYSTPVVPEPVSSTLFIIGGAAFGFRQYGRKLCKKI